MFPSGERLLRPILAFLTLCLAAFLLAPTVASVHEKIEALRIDRPLPWQIWTWTDEPEPSILPGCGKGHRHLYSEVTQWPAQIRKDEAFTLRGVVQSEEEGRRGVAQIDVDLFLNETKSEPGVHLGEVRSGAGGYFTLNALVPFELAASHYHIVAHAKQTQIDCTMYLEHWSDPETDVVSKALLEWERVDHAVVGRNLTLSGRLLDAVRAPVRNASVSILVLGKRVDVTTNDEGAFSLVHRPETPGNLTIQGTYTGGRYYEAVTNATTLRVKEEAFELSPAELLFTRSSPLELTGHAFVAPAAREADLTLTFAGTRVAACERCAPQASVEIPVDKEGAFRVSLTVLANESPGLAKLTVGGAGLRKTYDFRVRVEVPTTLTIEARDSTLFGRTYGRTVTLRDDRGPLAAPVALLGPEGWSHNATDPRGALALTSEAACGRHALQARYNGSDSVRPAQAQDEVLVCGWLAFVPPWLLTIPRWVWPLAAVALASAWWLVRGLRQRHATVIAGGPSLTLAFTEPADDATGYASIGEGLVATAFLEGPLPDGHKLRMGIGRATATQPLDGDLRAHLRVVPEKLGELVVRAEIVDPKGRVASRRCATLRVVRYAEEIETRYLRLRAATGATEDVTPREFQRWLHARAPALDPVVVGHLVRVFEEADYGPRAAGRADFAAYLAAEGGVEEAKAVA